jgi:fibronectin type 3 domain-containing protein
MIMKNKASLICLSIAKYFLAGLMCMALFISCTDTKIVTSSKIADGDCKATVSWGNVRYADSYNIYYSDSPGVTKQNGKKIANVGNPFTFEGLQRGKTYYAVVTAVSTNGESKESEEMSFTGM